MLMLLLTAAATTAGMPRERQKHVKHTDMETLQLTAEWDKTFPQSDKVLHTKITFHNRYGITLAADLYKPRGATGRLAAIAVCGPYGAVKEQVSGLYAQTLAERGFLTLAFDPSFCGESGGKPRCLTSPEISTDDFSAAVDCLLMRDDVDPERIGIVGICGWGGFALNAAANDPRIRATVTSTMYDMSRVNARGYFDSMSDEERYRLRVQLSARATTAPGSMHATAGWWTRCPTTLRSSSASITTTTRPRAGTTAAHPTRTTGSTGPIRLRSSTCRFSPVPARSAAPC